MRVLVVEDDEDFRLSLVDLLVKQGFDVASAEDALEALGLLEGSDIMLTDISLAGMDGLELCGVAHTRQPSLGIVVMTGYDSPHKRAEALRNGACAYLAKPFEKVDLLDGLRRASGSSLGKPIQNHSIDLHITQGVKP
jgi:two-component system response regulator FlrC